MEKIKSMKFEYEKQLKKYFKYHNDYIPNGGFCYKDITPSLRYYCKYLDTDKKCRLHNIQIFDFLKGCKTNRGNIKNEKTSN